MNIELYETEYPGIYVTEDGYFVDEYGDVYDEDGDLIEEDAVVLNEGEKAATATGATVGGLTGLAVANRVANRIHNNFNIKNGLLVRDKRGWVYTKKGSDFYKFKAKDPALRHLKRLPSGTKLIPTSQEYKKISKMKNIGRIGGVGLGMAAGAYGANKLYKYLKNK